MARTSRVLAIGAAIVLVGCAAITSFEGFVGDGPGVVIPDAGPPETSGEVDAGCGRKWPAPPTAGIGGGGVTLEGTMSKFRFTVETGQPPVGFDLDGVCTCLKIGDTPEPGSCRSKIDGLKGPCDVPAQGGVDNAAGELLRANLGKEVDFQQRVRAGRHGVAIRIQDYNGGQDDDAVLVDVYNVVGINGALDGTRNGNFDGNDRITIDVAGLANASGLKSFYASTNAYVTKGVLVAQLREYRLRLVIDAANVGEMDAGRPPTTLEQSVAEARLVGTIERIGETGVRMRDAQIAGRISADGLLSLAPRTGVCPDNLLYPTVKRSLCNYRDIQLDVSPTTNDKPCDAFSFALGLEIEPAKLTDFGTAPPLVVLCPDAGPDTCDD